MILQVKGTTVEIEYLQEGKEALVCQGKYKHGFTDVGQALDHVFDQMFIVCTGCPLDLQYHPQSSLTLTVQTHQSPPSLITSFADTQHSPIKTLISSVLSDVYNGLLLGVPNPFGGDGIVICICILNPPPSPGPFNITRGNYHHIYQKFLGLTQSAYLIIYSLSP